MDIVQRQHVRFFFEDGTRGKIDCKCWVLIINLREKMNIVFTMALTGFQGSYLEHERETDLTEKSKDTASSKRSDFSVKSQLMSKPYPNNPLL